MLRERTEALGYGDAKAPSGTEPWAQRWRLDLQAEVERLADLDARTVHTSLVVGAKYRAWTLLRSADGKPFRDFAAFCREAQPHGLGVDPERLLGILRSALGAADVQLLTVAPAQSPPGIAHVEKDHGGPLVKTSEKRLRAIAERAPEQVRSLYRAGLIGQDVAARLGPKNPTPEVAARVTEVAIALAAEAKDKPATEAERVAMQRRVNAKAREMLGCAVDPVERLARAYRALTPKERKRFLEAIGEQ